MRMHSRRHLIPAWEETEKFLFWGATGLCKQERDGTDSSPRGQDL